MSILALKVFYCYARTDKVLRDQLESHLEPLRRSKQITTWYDRKILPGREWKSEINERLNTSDIILLLISPSFIGSDYCYGIEMQRALERHRSGETHVIPIILRPVDWKNTPIGELQVLPTEGKPVSKWRLRDEAFEDIVRGVRDVVITLLTHKREEEEEAKAKAQEIILYEQKQRKAQEIILRIYKENKEKMLFRKDENEQVITIFVEGFGERLKLDVPCATKIREIVGAFYASQNWSLSISSHDIIKLGKPGSSYGSTYVFDGQGNIDKNMTICEAGAKNGYMLFIYEWLSGF